MNDTTATATEYDDYYDEDHELTYTDAVYSKVDGLYAEADAPGCPEPRARELAAKAHRLLATLDR